MTKTQLTTELAKALRLQTDAIEYRNFESFLSGHDRFGYAITHIAEGRMGFVKLAIGPTANQRLLCEQRGLAAANELGVSSPVIFDYLHIGMIGILHREYLQPEFGIIFAPPSRIAEAGRDFGVMMGHTVASLIATKVPEHTGLQNSHWRNRESSLVREWGHRLGYVTDAIRRGAIETSDPAEFSRYFSEVFWMAQELVEACASQGDRYFVHNDLSPGNVYLPYRPIGNMDRVVVMDFEYAGYSHNQVLAAISEGGYFYGRCWPNPDVQTSFIQAYGEQLAKMGLPAREIIIASIVFGVSILAYYAPTPSSPEYNMTEALFASLPSVIANAYALSLDSKEGILERLPVE